MEGHVKAVGYIHLVWSVMGLLTVLLFMLIFGSIGSFLLAHLPPQAAAANAHIVQVFTTVATVIFFLILMCSMPGLWAGYAILQHNEWARWILVVLSFMQLGAFPVGTAIGGYTLWVLLNNEASQFFDRRNY